MDIENSDGLSDQVADAIAYVCNNLADIRTYLESDGDPLVLDRLLAALRSGQDVACLLDRPEHGPAGSRGRGGRLR